MEGTVNCASRDDGRPALAGTGEGDTATGATATGAGAGATTGAGAGLETALTGALFAGLVAGLATGLVTDLAAAGGVAFLTISFTGLVALFGVGFWFFVTSTAFTAGILFAGALDGAADLANGWDDLAVGLTITLTAPLGAGLA